MPRTPIVVLDTNAVLDWLVFRNPAGAALYGAIAAGSVHWHATPAMHAELAHLLTRADFRVWGVSVEQLWAGWHAHCASIDAAPPAAARGGPRCTDPDDQKFVDFAVDSGARWLVTRDRAVLKLARRLRAQRVIVTTPAAWSLDDTTPRMNPDPPPT